MIELPVIMLPLIIALCVLGVILDSKRNLRLPGLSAFERRIVIEISSASADQPGSACDLKARDAL